MLTVGSGKPVVATRDSRRAIMRRLLGGVGLVFAVALAAVLLTSAPSQAVPSDSDGAGYVGLNPARLIDSRPGLQVGPFGSPWEAGVGRQVKVTGVGGVPESGVVAVVLNVTTVNPSEAFSWLTVTPTGAVANDTAAHNFGTASFSTEVLNDVVIAKVGDGGQIDIVNAQGSVDLVIDVVGYYTSNVARIEGGVIDGVTFEAIEGIRACADDFNQNLSYCTFTDAQGSYYLDGIAPGFYRVAFFDLEGTYLPMCFQDRPRCATPDFITLAAGDVRININAVLTPTATVSGVVTDSSGAAIEDIEACVRSLAISDRYCAQTSGAGTYTIDSIPPGNYTADFADPNGNYFSECYQDDRSCENAQALELAAASSTLGIDADLEPGGTIMGTVTSSATNAPLEGINLCATGLASGAELCTSTASDGTYEIGLLDLGDYTVRFFDVSGVYDVQCFSAADCDSATTVVVNNGDVTGIDAALVAPGSISGTVTDEKTSDPVEDVQVCALPLERCASTSSDGTYLITEVPAGDYEVQFTDPNGNYFSQCYINDADCQFAAIVTVEQLQETSGIDAALDSGGQIQGTVTSSLTDAALESIEVCADSTSGIILACATTGADGKYNVGNVPDGAYRVVFGDPNGLYFTECYFDDRNCSAPLLVSVTNGAVVTSIDADLDAAGTIEGTVTNSATGLPIANIDVCASNGTAYCAQTMADGSYQIGRLDPGNYVVTFRDPAGTFFVECYDSNLGCASPTNVSVDPGVTASGIDATLDPTGAITGVVIASDTLEPIEDLEVCGSNQTGPGFRCTRTMADGSYLLDQLAAGDYRVEFRPDGYLFECYQGTYTCNPPTLVTVVLGTATSGIDADLDPTGSITGRVTASDTGLPIEGHMVCATIDAFRCRDTAADGTYLIDGLAPGDYKVEFRGDDNYARECYPNSPSCFPETLVTVVGRTVTTNIDADLDPH